MAALDADVREGVDRETVETVQSMGKYKYGWETEIEMEFAPKGLSEEIVQLISEKNGEPEWMTEWRLQAYRRWVQMEEPRWAMVHYPKIDYQDQFYYAKPKSMGAKPKSLDEVDPKLLATYEKLGIPLKEQMILAGVEGAGEAPAEGGQAPLQHPLRLALLARDQPHDVLVHPLGRELGLDVGFPAILVLAHRADGVDRKSVV